MIAALALATQLLLGGAPQVAESQRAASRTRTRAKPPAPRPPPADTAARDAAPAPSESPAQASPPPGAAPPATAPVATAESDADRPWAVAFAPSQRRVLANVAVAPRLSLLRSPAIFELSAGGGVELPLWGDRVRARLMVPLRLLTSSASERDVQSTAVGVAIVPTAGLVVFPWSQVGLYSEVGAGLAVYQAQAEVPFIGAVTSYAAGVEASFAIGAEYALGDRWALFIEPISLRLHDAGRAHATFGDTTFTLPTTSPVSWAFRVGTSLRL